MALVKLTTKQCATLINGAVQQVLGKEALATEDLTNIVDLGVAIENANLYENFVEKLLVTIAKTYYVSKVYTSKAPNIARDNFEYGQIVQKVRTKLDEAVDNQSWQLQNGSSYDDNVFIENDVNVKIFASSVAWEIRKSVTNEQIKNAFHSASEMGSFLSMIMTYVDNSITLRTDALIMMCICNYAGEVANTNNASRYINLLSIYNTTRGTSLTVDSCLYDQTFLKFATGLISKYQNYLEEYTPIYNEEAYPTFTPKDKQHLVLISDFEANVNTFLAADTFHNEFVKLPYHEVVSKWQGMGTTGSLADRTSIKIKTSANHTVNMTGVLAMLFDHDAVGITQDQPRVTTKYVNAADFTNYWFKRKTSYFNDLSENFVVFYIA